MFALCTMDELPEVKGKRGSDVISIFNSCPPELYPDCIDVLSIKYGMLTSMYSYFMSPLPFVAFMAIPELEGVSPIGLLQLFELEGVKDGKSVLAVNELEGKSGLDDSSEPMDVEGDMGWCKL